MSHCNSGLRLRAWAATWRRVLGLAAVLACASYGVGAERLLWHEVRLDREGKLLSWVRGDSPYDQIVRRAWMAFKQIPVQPDGYRTYFTYPTFYGPNDAPHPLYSGRWWVHNPGSLCAMLTDSALLYHAYTGDREALGRAREMLDHYLTRGTTEATDAWSLVPYACSDPGDPVYQGAHDERYCSEQDTKPCGRGDGVGFLEPDKVGELGFAYLQFYEATLEKRYLEAAVRCGDALAANIRPGDQSHSPWPFRVDAKTGRRVREEYTANTIGPIRLLDELIRLRRPHQREYRRARDQAWTWLREYPLQNHVWTQYFEDVLIYPDYRTNVNQYSPLETVRYLLEHPQMDPRSRELAKATLDWVSQRFAADSVTMAGLPEKGTQWGAEVISEQVNDMDKMSSHTARYASVRAVWYELTGEADSKARAFRSFNWATYSSRENGLVKTSIDEGTGYWFSDGYGDYMRHFQRGMASVPEWAPPSEDHLLRSSSVVRQISYGEREIRYLTFDSSASEVLKLRYQPSEVRSGSSRLERVPDLNGVPEGYTAELSKSGGCVMRIKHTKSGQIRIQWNNG